MTAKDFKIKAGAFTELVKPPGSCFATDKITVEGLQIGYMYREAPNGKMDSGWRFFSGTEYQEYADNPDNTSMYNVNTIANYDRAIIPYLEYPVGTELQRTENTERFEIINR